MAGGGTKAAAARTSREGQTPRCPKALSTEDKKESYTRRSAEASLEGAVGFGEPPILLLTWRLSATPEAAACWAVLPKVPKLRTASHLPVREHPTWAWAWAHGSRHRRPSPRRFL